MECLVGRLKEPSRRGAEEQVALDMAVTRRPRVALLRSGAMGLLPSR